MAKAVLGSSCWWSGSSTLEHRASLQGQREVSEPFSMTNGMKQACVLAPTLFSIMFSAMQMDTFRDSDISVDFRYWTDEKLFNLRRLQAKTKVKEDIARDFLFVDDCYHTVWHAGKHGLFATAGDDCGLTRCTKETEVMHQQAPGTSYIEPTPPPSPSTGKCSRWQTNLYTLEIPCHTLVIIDDETTYWLARASSAFGRLRDAVWEEG